MSIPRFSAIVGAMRSFIFIIICLLATPAIAWEAGCVANCGTGSPPSYNPPTYYEAPAATEPASRTNEEQSYINEQIMKAERRRLEQEEKDKKARRFDEIWERNAQIRELQRNREQSIMDAFQNPRYEVSEYEKTIRTIEVPAPVSVTPKLSKQQKIRARFPNLHKRLKPIADWIELQYAQTISWIHDKAVVSSSALSDAKKMFDDLLSMDIRLLDTISDGMQKNVENGSSSDLSDHGRSRDYSNRLGYTFEETDTNVNGLVSERIKSDLNME